MEAEKNVFQEIEESTNRRRGNKGDCTMVKNFKEGSNFQIEITIPVQIREYTKRVKEFLDIIVALKSRLNGEPAHYNVFIEKYFKFIDLKFKYPDLQILPSTELEWIWYTHLLRPKFYLAFCNKKYGGKIIPHTLEDFFLGRERPDLLAETASLFEKEYNEPYFFPEELPVLQTREEKEIKFLETADLYNDWSWWGTLQQQKGYGTKEFEDMSEKGYYDYLQEVFTTGTRLGPPIHIDLFWHTHIIHPQHYHDDCMKMFGEVIFHTPLGTVGRWCDFPSHLTKDKQFNCYYSEESLPTKVQDNGQTNVQDNVGQTNAQDNVGQTDIQDNAGQANIQTDVQDCAESVNGVPTTST